MTENNSNDAVKTKALVAIRCITYNHEAYIRDALEGFIMQKTNFPFVAIVHDDASTDGTADIIREYAAKYPDIIKPIYETENQYSKHDGSLGRIMTAACEATGAKYIAMCEGDDYWTDPLKLQKQVDFLETHPDYSMCFHKAIVHYEDGLKPSDISVFANRIKDNNSNFQNHLLANLETRDYEVLEYAKSWFTPTASVMFKSKCLQSIYTKKIAECKDFYFGDIPLWFTCGVQGKIFGFKEPMSCYRIQNTGINRAVNSVPVHKRLKVYRAYISIFPDPIKSFYKNKTAKEAIFAISVLKKGDIRESLKILKICFEIAPYGSLREIILYPYTITRNLITQK